MAATGNRSKVTIHGTELDAVCTSVKSSIRKDRARLRETGSLETQACLRDLGNDCFN